MLVASSTSSPILRWLMNRGSGLTWQLNSARQQLLRALTALCFPQAPLIT